MADALAIRRLEVWYGESKVVHGMDLSVRAGEVVALLGRNGAGKTTALKAVMGLLKKRSGSIRLGGEEIIDAAPFDVARKGIAFCPEERGIFASLSVRENLLLPPKIAQGGMPVDQILELFPNLKERFGSQGTKLSGGEQQMLALARILRTGARVLLLDEPTEGLAPVIIQQIGRTLSHLKTLGFTILLVEQNAGFVCGLADRHYVVELGRIVDEIAGSEFEQRLDFVNSYLGL